MKQSVWTFFWLLTLLIVFGILTSIHPISLLSNLFNFYTGDISHVTLNLAQGATLILHLSLITLVMSIVISLLTQPKNVETIHINLFNSGPISVYLIILAEELFRYLFVVLLPGWFHANLTATIIFLVIGNLIWTILHVYNFKGSLIKRLITTLPIFILGFVFGPMLIRYGFLVTFLVHYTYDVLVWSMEKAQFHTFKYIFNFFYWSALAVVIYFLMQSAGLSLAAILPWITAQELVSLNLSFWNYVLLFTFIDSLSGISSNWLGLDSSTTVPPNKYTLGEKILGIFIGLVPVILLYIGLVIGINWLLSHWITNTLIRAVIIACLSTIFNQPKSGSGMAKLWFFTAPVTFITVFFVSTVTFPVAVGVLCVNSLAGLIPGLVEAS